MQHRLFFVKVVEGQYLYRLILKSSNLPAGTFISLFCYLDNIIYNVRSLWMIRLVGTFWVRSVHLRQNIFLFWIELVKSGLPQVLWTGSVLQLGCFLAELTGRD